MKTSVVVIAAMAGFVFILGAIFVSKGIGYYDQEVALRKQIEAKSTANEAALDTMWKTLSQKAGITKEAKANIQDMNTIYEEITSPRSGGALFKSVQENYPNLGQKEIIKLYENLMSSVESERKVFKRDQEELVDLVRERSALREGFVSGFMLKLFGGNTLEFKRRGYATTPPNWPHQYVFVTSGKTQEIAHSGEENDIDLFK
jgi:hypothetical protein